jgi:hypothetical protein
LQGLSRKGYVSKPPLPEVREANRLHAEVEKKNDEAKAARKRERKENHEKAFVQAWGMAG